jgi:TatD DNase family protein
VWSDAHIHLDDLPDDRLVGALWSDPAWRALVPSGEPADALAARERFGADPRIRYAAGVHPWYLPDDVSVAPEADPRIEALRDIVTNGGFHAVGEIGLDALRHPDEPRRAQADAYLDAQVRIARAAGLPVVLHCVRSHARAQAIVRSVAPRGTAGMVHAFAGSVEEARAWIRLGLFVSIGAAVTRPQSHRVRRVAAALPLDALLVETDAPFMAAWPAPPGGGGIDDLRDVVSNVAELRGADPGAIGAAAAANLERMLAGEHAVAGGA